MSFLIVIIVAVVLFSARPLIVKLLVPILRPIMERKALKSTTDSANTTQSNRDATIFDKSIQSSGNFAIDLQNQHNAKKKIHMVNMEYNDLSRIVQVKGEVEYLQLHPNKLNTNIFNARFKQYLDCFLWLDDQPALDDEIILNNIESILDAHNYLELSSFEGHTGVAIKSAFLCALVSTNKNNIRSAYMKGKNSSHDKRFIAKHTNQEYTDYMYEQYPVLVMAIEKLEPKRQKSIISIMGYVLYGEW